jgi:hypothetical protein
MSTMSDDLLVAFELHSVERIRGILDAGFDVHAPIRGKAPITLLIEMYSRSDRFADCLRLMLDRGAMLEDPMLRPVLLNDVAELEAAIRSKPDLINHRTSLISAFTPLMGATLLHVAAEYGHLAVARRLLQLGAEADARAATDALGFNGHTPLFHTVNSNANRAEPVMRLLLDAGARPDIHLPGITWGKGFEWETLCLDVTPISYAQLGLLRQMQRNESHIYANISTLLRAAGRAVPAFDNVPNKYLAS